MILTFTAFKPQPQEVLNEVKGGEFIGPDGFQQLRGYPTRVDADEYSKDVEFAQQLWKVSEDMTDVFYLSDRAKEKESG